MNAARLRRDTISLLKLARHILTPAAEDPRSLTTEDGRVRRVASGLVDALVSDGALLRTREGVSRGPAGVARLRRLLAGPGSTASADPAPGAASSMAAPPNGGALAADVHAAQHRDLAPADMRDDQGATVAAPLNLAASPLARLARMGGGKDSSKAGGADGGAGGGKPFLHPELVEAARRLLTDFERAQLRQRVTVDWSGAGGGGRRDGAGRADIADSAADAHRRWHEAVAAIAGESGGAVVDLVCFEKGLTDIERERGWPKRAGKLMLRAGLEQLARHYREPRPARPPG